MINHELEIEKTISDFNSLIKFLVEGDPERRSVAATVAFAKDVTYTHLFGAKPF